jgi:hypothetical protein
MILAAPLPNQPDDPKLPLCGALQNTLYQYRIRALQVLRAVWPALDPKSDEIRYGFNAQYQDQGKRAL